MHLNIFLWFRDELLTNFFITDSENFIIIIVYEPRAGALEPALRKYPQLHDPDYANKHFRLPEYNSPLVLP